MPMNSIARGAALVAVLALPLAVHAAPVTFNMLADLFEPSAEPPAGRLTGSIEYDFETGVFLSSRLWVTLNDGGHLFELATIDEESSGNSLRLVDGESTNKDHKGEIEIVLSETPGPRSFTINFGGRFVDVFPDVTTVAYGVRGVATLAIPEPATSALLAASLVAAALVRRGRGRVVRSIRMPEVHSS